MSAQKKRSRKSETSRPTLSVCMIVKNEEKVLDRCLASVKNIADEIVIVDTGSTDKTVEIARKYGAKIYHHPWENNFSLHRNQSLSYATGDWILQIDADEELENDSQKILLDTIRHAPKGVNGYMVMIQDVRSDGRLGVLFNYPRLFKNRVGAKYIGRVHNQVYIPGKIQFSKVKLFHYGYDLDRKTMLRKFKRTTSLLKKWIKEEPDDPTPYFYLANGYSQYERPQKCIEYSVKTLQLLKKQNTAPQFFLSIYYALVTSLISLKQLDEAESYAKESIKIKEDYLDGYYLLSSIAYLKKDFKQAVKYGKRYIELLKEYKENPELLGSLNIYTLSKEAKFRYWYGVSLMATGHKDEGLQNIEQAIEDPLGKNSMAIEACHNAIVAADLETGKQLYKKLFFKYGKDAAFVLHMAQDLASIDWLIWLDEWSKEFVPDQKFQNALDGLTLFFAKSIYYPINHQELKPLLEEILRNQERQIPHELHQALSTIASDIFNDQAGQEAEKELQVAIKLYERISKNIQDDKFNSDRHYLILYNATQTNLEHHLKEWIIIRSILEAAQAIREENIDLLLLNLRSIANLMDIAFPLEFNDVEQILQLFIKIGSECDAYAMPDAAMAAIGTAQQFFQDSLSMKVVILKRKIVRSQRLGRYPEWLRIILKYFYPPTNSIENLRMQMEKLNQNELNHADVNEVA